MVRLRGTLHGLGEELVAVARKRLSIDRAALDRPEAPTAGFVAQYAVLFVVPMKTHWRGSITSCAHSLAGTFRVRVTNAFSAAVSARSSAESSAISISHLPLQMLRDILDRADVRQIVGEPLARRGSRRLST